MVQTRNAQKLLQGLLLTVLEIDVSITLLGQKGYIDQHLW